MAAVWLATAEAMAQTPDATLTVRIAVAASSQGVFNNGGLLATQVTVFARSGAQARYNGPTNIHAPTMGTQGAGSTFTVTVPNLYSPMATGAPNPYTLELTWNDTSVRTVTNGPITLVRGTANTAGPITIDNQAPPGSSSIMCYPNAPRGSTELYVYWSYPSSRPVDFDRFELHRSTTASFTPSASTLVAPLPYGTSNRVDTGRTPNTAYYYCLRTLDQYGAFTDRCTTVPCRTEMGMVDAGPDVADAPRDTPSDPVADAPMDVVTDRTDAAMDMAMDVVTDRTDAAMDMAMDAVTDRTDAAMDMAMDAVTDRTDAAMDSPLDRSDVVIDLGGMAGFTSTPPTLARANTPYIYTPRAVSASGAPATGYRATDLPPGATIDPTTGAIVWIPSFGEVGMMRVFTVIATLPGGGEIRQTVTVTVTCPDNDRDGRNDIRCDRGVTGGDCDDMRSDTFPEAPERCNGIDDDCDGFVDEEDAVSLCGPGQTCDPNARTCRPTCSSASECTAAPRMCTRDGTCSLCTPGPMGDATACAGAEDGRACLSDSLGGVFCGCNTDADCGGPNSGRLCDLERHRCMSGCSTDAGRNGCPMGQRCVMAGTGSAARGTCTRDCTATPMCASLSMLPLCPETGVRRCVECLSDANCSGNTDGRVYCDAASGNCVACLLGGVSQCTAAGLGAACLPGGICGCNSDADCGARDSGRVCDTVTRVCRAGCRLPGTTGNACPRGFVCEAVGTNVGRCAPSVSDAGADADGGDGASGDAPWPDTPSNDGTIVDGTMPDAPSDDGAIVDRTTPDAPADGVPIDDRSMVVDVMSDLGSDAAPQTGDAKGGCGCRTQVLGPRAVTPWGLLALLALASRRRRGCG